MDYHLQARFAAYLAYHALDTSAGQIEALAPLAGGWASDVYAVSLAGTGGAAPRTLVLKTYAPTDAGAMHGAREWQALTRLHAVPFPVPRALRFEPDPQLIGAPFVVMEHVPGSSLWDAYEAAGQPERDRLVAVFAGQLALLHSLDPRVVEPRWVVGDADEPLSRELRRLRQDSARLRSHALLAVVGWLETRSQEVPCPRPALLHRDYHPWNVLVERGRLWVLDWDWSIGDARFDLAWTTTLLRRSGFDAFAAAVAASYQAQAEPPAGDLAYFEVLATARWLCTVLAALEPGQGRGDADQEQFRAFLHDPVRRAEECIAAQTGIPLGIRLERRS